MCSIMGMFGEVTDIEKFNEGFKETLSRGPDDTRVTQVEGGILGFHRLAIMGLSPEGMQPFKLNSKFLICNGEIYGLSIMPTSTTRRFIRDTCTSEPSNSRNRKKVQTAWSSAKIT